MNKNTKTELCFTTPSLIAEMIENVQNYTINEPTIIVNTSEKVVEIKGTSLKPWESAVYQNTVIEAADSLICMTPRVNNFLKEKCSFADEMTDNWTHVYSIFPAPHLKETQLWRSDQCKIGDSSFNLWFAKAGTNCGLHNEHDFKEIHTQVYGIGRMQKFDNNDYESLYQDVYMSPGFTHEPFYDEKADYPWHQYFADTDCIWLVREF